MKKRISLTLECEDGLARYMTAVTQCLWDHGQNDYVKSREMIDYRLIDGLCNGDIDKIRSGFVEGSTCMLMTPKDMEVLNKYWKDRVNASPDNDSLEIRVFHTGKLLGVILENEIDF